MLWLEFVLFLILGLAVFVPLSANARIVAMIVFTVLMVLWLVLGPLGVSFPQHWR